MSELVFEHKHKDRDYIVEIKIYKVNKDQFHPEGFHYSLVLIKDGKRLLGYDNHERKGHHTHRGKGESPYEFVDEVTERYIELYENIIGEKFVKEKSEGVLSRIESNVSKYLESI